MGKVHVIGVGYDKRFPQERRVTLSYEGSKPVAIGVLNDKVWRACGLRSGQETTTIKDVVVENIDGRQGEYAADRAAGIARESGLTLARRSPRWLTHGTSRRVHFGKARLALRFSIISTEVPNTVRDRGLVIGTVYEYVRDQPDWAHYMKVLAYRVTVVPPEAQKPRQWAPPIPFVKYAQGCDTCPQPGHYSRTCWRNPRMPQCGICHQQVHWSEECKGHHSKAKEPCDTPSRC